MSKVPKIEIKVNPLLLTQEAEIKEVVPKFYEAFRKDLKDFDVEGATKEIILDSIPTEPVLVNHACIWNNPFAIGKRVMIVATINDKFAFVEMMNNDAPQIYRLEDLGSF
jgi:hypothetical protein